MRLDSERNTTRVLEAEAPPLTFAMTDHDIMPAFHYSAN